MNDEEAQEEEKEVKMYDIRTHLSWSHFRHEKMKFFHFACTLCHNSRTYQRQDKNKRWMCSHHLGSEMKRNSKLLKKIN